MNVLKRLVPLLAVSMSMVLPSAFAQSSTGAAPQWKNTVELYLLGPSLDGSVGLGPIDGDVNVDAGTVFDALDGAFLGTYVGEAKRWGVLADLAYMDLKEDGSGPQGLVDYEVNVKQTIFGLVGTYRLTDTLQFTFGGRYIDVTNRLTLAGPNQQGAVKASESWFDPTVGLRYVAPLGEKWVFNGAADIGGFGVGSDFTWYWAANIAYRMTPWAQIYAGYRYVDFDYESGEGRDRFKFDMAQHGPLVGFRFEF
jgi:hypothetical protein